MNQKSNPMLVGNMNIDQSNNNRVLKQRFSAKAGQKPVSR